MQLLAERMWEYGLDLYSALPRGRRKAAGYALPVLAATLFGMAQPPAVLGQIFAFGSSSFDVLGNNNTGNTIIPQTPNISGATSVSAGSAHVLATKADGSVWAWGSNKYGELGSPASNTPNPTPVQVGGLTGVMAVAAGTSHSLALKSDGTVWAWGLNQFGQLGNPTNSGTTVANPTPTQVSGLTGVVAIAGMYDHCLALKADGTIWAWGYNYYGQLGNTTHNGSSAANPIPTQIGGLTGFVALATGSMHSVALKADGTVWAWGWNGYGQLGFSATNNANPTPLPVSGLTGITAIASGDYHCLALRSDGTVWAWGYNADGELGYGAITDYTYTPVQSDSLSGITNISAGDAHSAALKNDGTVWTWGFNFFGELGTSTNFATGNPNPTTAMVPGLNNIGGIFASPGDNTFVIIPAPVNITIASAATAVDFTVSGLACQPGTWASNTTLSWTPGASCQVSFPSPQSAGAGTQDVFKDWQDGPAGGTRTFTVPPINTTYTADFKTQYLLTVLANPSTEGAVTGGGYYDANSSAPVAATPDAGYLLAGWTGPVASPNSATTTVTMTGPLTVTANFVPSIIIVTAGVTAANKTYDRTASASITACTLSGVAPADQGNVTCSVGSASFSDANVGGGKTVTATGIVLTMSGSASGKYGLAFTTATTTAGINALALTAGVIAANKIYDGATTATITGCTPNGVIPGDSVTCTAGSAAFASANAGTNWTVTATGIVLGGSQAGNYTLNPNTATTTATISRATAVISESGPSASIYGQPVTLTMNLTPPAGTVPTGLAYFSYLRNSTTYYICSNGTISSAALCNVNIAFNGVTYGASVATSQLPVGTEGITASYSGDSNFNGGSANNLSINVSRADTAITLSKSPDPSVYGDSVAMTIKVKDNTTNSAAVPSGTVALSFKLNPGDVTTYNLCGDGTMSASPCASAITLFPDPADSAGKTATATVTTFKLPAGPSAYSFAYVLNGTYSGDANFNVSGPMGLTQTVNQRAISVTAAADSKTYDGTTGSTRLPAITGGTLAALDTASFTQAFDSRNAGSRTLTPSGIVNDGNGGNNYSYTFNTAAGTITQRAITLTATAATKIYDGTNSSTAAPSLTTGTLATGDTTTSFSQIFDSRNAGSRTLIPSGIVNDGNGGNNYSYTYSTAAGAITQRAITVTATAFTKAYDGTPGSAAAPTITAGTLATGDTTTSFRQIFDSRNAGSRTLTPSGIANDGNGGTNYSYTFAIAAGTINKAPLMITAATNTKIFDGSISAAALPTFSALQPGDTLTGLAETYDTPNMGIGKTLSVSAYTLNDGNNGGNYAVSKVPNNTGVVTPVSEIGTLKLSASTASYTDAATFTATLPTAVLGGEFAASSVSFYICSAGTASPGPSCQNMTPTPAALTAAGGGLTGSATVNLLETVSGALAPGAHTVLAVFAAGPDFALNIPSASLQITKKVTLPTGNTIYTGATTYFAPSPNSNSGTLYLAATVTDPCGTYPAGYAVCGDVSNGTVTFNIVNGTSLTPIDGATNLPVGLVTPGNTTVGAAAATVSFHPKNYPTPLAIQMTVGSYFTGGDPSQGVIVLISQSASVNEVSLSGSLLCNSTTSILPPGANNQHGSCAGYSSQPNAGLLMGVPTQLTQLDGDVNHAKGSVTAQIVSMYKPDGTLDTKPHTYQIRSNDIAAFSLISAGVATFSATANLHETGNSGSDGSKNDADNALMQITACAPGASCPGLSGPAGNAGAIAIQVNSLHTGAVWFSSGWNGRQTVPQNAAAGVVGIN